jgi:hypothetical protein
MLSGDKFIIIQIFCNTWGGFVLATSSKFPEHGSYKSLIDFRNFKKRVQNCEPHRSKAHFRLGVPWSKFVGTNLDSFETRIFAPVGPSFGDPSLHVGSSDHELSNLALSFFWSEPIDLPSKMVPCRFSLDLSLSGHKFSSNLWLSANSISLFLGTLDFGPSSKVALRKPWVPIKITTGLFRQVQLKSYKRAINY